MEEMVRIVCSFKHAATSESMAARGNRIVTVNRWRFQVPDRVITHVSAWVLHVVGTFIADCADIRAHGYIPLHDLAP